MGTLKRFINKLFKKPELTQPTHTGTEYKPLRAIHFTSTKKKHSLHKHHFGNFTPLK